MNKYKKYCRKYEIVWRCNKSLSRHNLVWYIILLYFKMHLTAKTILYSSPWGNMQRHALPQRQVRPTGRFLFQCYQLLFSPITFLLFSASIVSSNSFAWSEHCWEQLWEISLPADFVENGFLWGRLLLSL